MAETISLAFSTDFSDVRTELKKLPGMTEATAKKMADAFEPQFKKMQKSAKKTGSVVEAELTNVAEAGGDSERALIGLADVLEKVSPAAADAVRGLADVSGGIEGILKGSEALNPSLAAAAINIGGPVAAAVAVLGAAYASLTMELEAAMAAQERAAAVAAAVASAVRAQEIAELRLAVAKGVVADAVLQEALAQDQANAVFAQARAEIQAETEAIQKSIEWKETFLGSLQTLTAQYNEWISAIGNSLGPLGSLGSLIANITGLFADDERTVADLTVKMQGLETQEDNLKTATKNLAGTLVELGDVTIANAEATREAAQADRERQQAIADMIAEVEDFVAVQQAMSDELLALEFGQVYVDVLATIEEINEAVKMGALDEQDAIKLRKAAWTDYRQHVEKQTEIAAKKAEEELEAQLERQQLLVSLSMDSMTAIAEAAEAVLEASGKRSANIAKKLFRFKQVLAIAETIINTAQAMSRAFKDYIFPVSVGVAAAVGVLGTAQTIAIAAQKPPEFPIGGVVGGSADHTTIGVQEGEAILNRAATGALGEDAINDINAGMGGGGSLVVVQQYKHRTFDAVVEDNVRIPGSTMQRLSSRGRRAGRRK
jgi:hypothetical protein